MSQAEPAAIHSGEPYEVPPLRVTQQPLLQELAAQQGVAVAADVPAVPHTTQSEFLHIVPASVQVLFAQHGPPAAPHALQTLDELSQAVPGSLHAGVEDVELEQQAWPVPPHALHVYVYVE